MFLILLYEKIITGFQVNTREWKMTDITETKIDENKRKNAIKASRTMLLMQWPVYTVLGLVGIILPLMGVVDETALISTILLITSGT